MLQSKYKPDSIEAELSFLNATKEDNQFWCVKIMDFGKRRCEFTTFMPNKGLGSALIPRVKPPLTDEQKTARSQRIAVARAKRMVRYRVKSLDADHMLTLTYRGVMDSEERLRADIQEFARGVHAKYPEWKYIGVKERHDSGGFHMHFAVKGRQDVKHLRAVWWRIVGEAQGNIDVAGPKKRWGNEGARWNTHKLAAYMCKYMTKEFDETLANKKRYWASKGIDLPAPFYFWLGATNFPDAVVETWDYVKAFRCTKSKMFAQEDWSVVWIDCSG